MRGFAVAACLVLSACAGGAIGGIYAEPAEAPVLANSPHVTAALADARRPAADRERDAARRPDEMLAFARIAPGDRVAEILPGRGYFTRVFAVAVGDTGRVYPVIRPEATAAPFEAPILEVAVQYPSAQVVRSEFGAMTFPEPLDVVFTAQNYHDIKIAQFNFGDVNAMNRAAFAALKPGGYYIVIDHSAVDGSGDSAIQTLHRIDQAVVRREVEAAGFVFDAETQVLRNPQDPRTQNVFDEAIRGHTDQFVLRFRKPG